ncbi:hypothetical protein Aperf_G00000076724 [Anoplocephala perfoliata]
MFAFFPDALNSHPTRITINSVNFHAPQTPPTIEADVYTISPELQTGSGSELFAFIAETVKTFLQERNLLDIPLDMGFTFSFPVSQEGINRGKLIRWTKGFGASGVIGKDVVELLNKALSDLVGEFNLKFISLMKDLKVTCRALVNDTVGALASCAFLDPETAAGLIVGTGTNAAYVEQLSAAKKITDLPPTATSVVINIEWGAFGDHGCLAEFFTEYDRIVDAESVNPGEQIFEKMSSGMYIGELVRYLLRKLIDEKVLFEGITPEGLDKKDSFPTYYLSEVDRDPTHLFYSTEYILRESFKMTKFTNEDLKIVRYVCTSVANRAASFVAAGLVATIVFTYFGIACILNRMDRPRTTIAVDGSLFKFHPVFARTMVEVITKLIPPRCAFRLKLSEDGSGKGAGALVAAVKRSIVEP